MFVDIVREKVKLGFISSCLISRFIVILIIM